MGKVQFEFTVTNRILLNYSGFALFVYEKFGLIHKKSLVTAGNRKNMIPKPAILVKAGIPPAAIDDPALQICHSLLRENDGRLRVGVKFPV